MSANDKDIAKNRERYFKRNFWVGVLNGTFFRGGCAFLDPSTVLPEFLSYLTPSSSIIGGVSAIFRAGMLFTQILTANFLETRAYKKPVYNLAAKIRIISVFTLAFVVYFFGARSNNFALLMFLLVYIIYSFASGLGVLPFSDIVAKTIYERKRGLFMALRWSTGSLLSLGVGYIVARVLSKRDLFPFPANFAFLFLLGGITITIALCIFSFGVKEPPQKNIRKNVIGFKEYLKTALKNLCYDKNYAYLLITRLFAGAEALSMPFFIRYARTILNMRPEITGSYLSVKMIGGMIAVLIWGKVGDRHGNKLLVQFICLLGSLIVAWALSAKLLVDQIYLLIPLINELALLKIIYGVVFFMVGGYLAGQIMAFNNLLLEIAPEEKRPSYIGIFNSIVGFELLILPLIGGIIVDTFSYKIMFMISLFLQSGGVIFSFKLEEPRDE